MGFLILFKIKIILQRHNTFLYQLKQNVEIYKSAPSFKISLNNDEPANAATRTYNLPTTTNVAAIVVGDMNSRVDKYTWYIPKL